MRTLTIPLALALGCLTLSATVQEDPSLLGQPAPELSTKDFFQSNGRTSVADYKGEVLLVEKFATWCGPCVGMMPHLSKLQEEYGKKGFHILSITNEPRDTVLKFMTQLNVTEIAYTMGCGGGADAYPARGIPKAFLIGVDGKVIWEGHPGELSNKQIEEELKKVKFTPEMRTAAAERALQYAESLIGAKQYLRGQNALERISREHKGTPAAAQATDRLAGLAKDEAFTKELAAQRTLDKLVGGLEIPAEKLKSKDRVSKAKQVASLAEKIQAEAPATAELAQQWVKVLQEDWSSGH